MRKNGRNRQKSNKSRKELDGEEHNMKRNNKWP